MTDPAQIQQTRRSDRFAYDPRTQPELFEGVLSKRIIAFLIDALLIVALMIPAALVVFVLGVVTLGIGWLLFPVLFILGSLYLVVNTLLQRPFESLAGFGLLVIGLPVYFYWSGRSSDRPNGAAGLETG